MRRLLILAAILVPATLAALAWRPAAPAEAVPVAAAPRPVPAGGVWHTVQEGEDLRAIARRHYGTARLARSLQLANDSTLCPGAGRRLWIPALAAGWDGLEGDGSIAPAGRP